jgi:hypothetical protein
MTKCFLLFWFCLLFLFSGFFYPEDCSSTFLQNVGKCLPHYTALLRSSNAKRFPKGRCWTLSIRIQYANGFTSGRYTLAEPAKTERRSKTPPVATPTASVWECIPLINRWSRVLSRNYNLSASQEIPCLLWKTNVHCHTHKSHQWMNPVHTLTQF